jgi:hypothetical protein
MMTLRFTKYLILSCVFIFTLQNSLASEPDTIVWQDETEKFEGIHIIEILPTSGLVELEYYDEVSSSITNTIRQELEKAGISIVYIENNKTPFKYALQSEVIEYQPGSIGERWLGLGGGSVVCILRTILYHDSIDNKIAEIIVARVLSGGGLFSAGAESYIPKQVAQKTAKEVATMLGKKTEE